ncbi:uncharacterized protein KGF55_003066 [Candida pseudojiufengensis]|uniref:uncharacterized protein n=1 Tax=Candida pseudojiufengensis TaxID=497109 RepID=UPI0022251AB6|nr:uncharacterized protein KGF55_003066 [Candida pseudojiufengensis]KAI5963274.1 hypothetical protein KGF55_003066 [Candida pseudojiufengensis]
MKDQTTTYNPWEKHIQQISGIIQSAPTHDLNVMLIAKLMNTFIFSKLYYRDLHTPLRNYEIEEIHQIIGKKLPQNMAITRAQTPRELGGFGLINIANQISKFTEYSRKKVVT